MIYLAQQEDGRAIASEIAAAMDIPAGFLHQVLRELQRARLLNSKPSRTGGYTLTRPADKISVLEVVEALEGPVDEECALRGGPCHWGEVCALHWVWSAAREAFSGELAHATIAQVAEDDRSLSTGQRSVPSDSHRLTPSNIEAWSNPPVTPTCP